MSKDDLEINRNVRRVFVRHWLDLGRLFMRSANGAVSIRGALMRIAGVKDELTPQAVETIFGEVKRIKNVRRMNIDLENWTNDLGTWKRVDRRKNASTPSSQVLMGGKKRSYDIQATEKKEEEDDA